MEQQEELKIPSVELMNALVFLNRKTRNVLTEPNLQSDEESVYTNAFNAYEAQEQFLLENGFDKDESYSLLEAVKKYNLFVSDWKGNSSMWLIMFVVCCIATPALAWFNYYLYTDEHRIWFLPIILNIFSLLGIFVCSFSFFGDLSARKKVKKREYSSADDIIYSEEIAGMSDYLTSNSDVTRIEDIKEHARYLITHHNYNAEALALYLCQYELASTDIEILINELGLSPNEKR